MPSADDPYTEFVHTLEASTLEERETLARYPVLGSVAAKLFWSLLDCARWHGDGARGEAAATVTELLTQAAFAFQAAVRLLLARQTYAVPALGRLIIELCLYANHLQQHPGDAAVYHGRHVGADGSIDQPGWGPTTRKAVPAMGAAPHDGRKKMTAAFGVNRLFASLDQTLADVSPDTARKLRYNYEAYIDAGAHPNPQLLSSHRLVNPTSQRIELALHAKHPHVVLSAAHALYYATYRCARVAVQLRVAPVDGGEAHRLHTLLDQLKRTELAELETLRRASEQSWRDAVGGSSTDQAQPT